jgi:hypothetical protein
MSQQSSPFGIFGQQGPQFGQQGQQFGQGPQFGQAAFPSGANPMFNPGSAPVVPGQINYYNAPEGPIGPTPGNGQLYSNVIYGTPPTQNFGFGST